jgi:hypothetical protein
MYLANEDDQLTAAKDERFPLPEDEALRALVGDATAAQRPEFIHLLYIVISGVISHYIH